MKRILDDDGAKDVDELRAVSSAMRLIRLITPCSTNHRRGLKAIAFGFAYLHKLDDHKKIELETPMYDALYAFCQQQVEKENAAVWAVIGLAALLWGVGATSVAVVGLVQRRSTPG